SSVISGSLFSWYSRANMSIFCSISWGVTVHFDAINFGNFYLCVFGVLDRRMTSVPLKIVSNNLKTPATVIDKIMDYLAVCRLTLERGHQSHLFCAIRASVRLSDHIVSCFGNSVKEQRDRP